MNSPILSLHRPWWQRAADSLLAALARWREERALRREIAAAREMDESTLRDIGAPQWLIEEARHQREQARFDRELQRVRADPASPRYW